MMTPQIMPLSWASSKTMGVSQERRGGIRSSCSAKVGGGSFGISGLTRFRANRCILWAGWARRLTLSVWTEGARHSRESGQGGAYRGRISLSRSYMLGSCGSSINQSFLLLRFTDAAKRKLGEVVAFRGCVTRVPSRHRSTQFRRRIKFPRREHPGFFC